MFIVLIAAFPVLLYFWTKATSTPEFSDDEKSVVVVATLLYLLFWVSEIESWIGTKQLW